MCLGGAGGVGEWVKFRVLGSSEGFQRIREALNLFVGRGANREGDKN